jgi:hypothetical protein
MQTAKDDLFCDSWEDQFSNWAVSGHPLQELTLLDGRA